MCIFIDISFSHNFLPDPRLLVLKFREKPRNRAPDTVFDLQHTSPFDHTVGPLCYQPISLAPQMDDP
jgi:hypothetical protein